MSTSLSRHHRAPDPRPPVRERAAVVSVKGSAVLDGELSRHSRGTEKAKIFEVVIRGFVSALAALTFGALVVVVVKIVLAQVR